ncbi:MAG: MarR family transcriptional regulator, partial [Alphaproteobacteria bacterium]
MSIKLTFGQALDVWRGAILETVRRDTADLSARQMAVILTVYLTA